MTKDLNEGARTLSLPASIRNRPSGCPTERSRPEGSAALSSVVQVSAVTDAAGGGGLAGDQSKRAKRAEGKAHKLLDLALQDGKLLDVATEIYGNPPRGDDMAFTHAVFCQVGLPRSRVEGREFMRQSGAAWVNVQAGYLDEGQGPVQQPVPYGALPRLALAHLSTHAVRHKTREIPIGGSAAQFLELMGMDTQGARYTNLRRQMHALAACRLQLGYKGRTFNGQAIEQFDRLAGEQGHQAAGLVAQTDGANRALL